MARSVAGSLQAGPMVQTILDLVNWRRLMRLR
jgi:hypothetical protein